MAVMLLSSGARKTYSRNYKNEMVRQALSTLFDDLTLDPDAVRQALPGEHVYRLGGNSCLSGDFMGSWRFDHELKVGERIIFEDMIHYTTVKTNMFNGVRHPDIALLHTDGTLEYYRRFGYEDYRDRMC